MVTQMELEAKQEPLIGPREEHRVWAYVHLMHLCLAVTCLLPSLLLRWLMWPRVLVLSLQGLGQEAKHANTGTISLQRRPRCESDTVAHREWWCALPAACIDSFTLWYCAGSEQAQKL